MPKKPKQYAMNIFIFHMHMYSREYIHNGRRLVWASQSIIIQKQQGSFIC